MDNESPYHSSDMSPLSAVLLSELFKASERREDDLRRREEEIRRREYMELNPLHYYLRHAWTKGKR